MFDNELDIRWELHDGHAATLSLANGKASAEVGVTYSTDAFLGLVRAAGDVKSGSVATYTLAAGEPTGAILFLSRVGDQLDIRLVSFSAMSAAMTRFVDGELIWYTAVFCSRFVEAVLNMADAVEQRYGVEGFARLWGHPFPVSIIETVRALRPSSWSNEFQ